eukprot:TRINITY_DN1035_c0_g1_i1.p1 TRINITY_DN1035_c0_g1~~TRINITY_DN1035_c0_g1_i1.p1  ORF type:complete len:238 (-),score=31.86 TRINITY_DN1035_c0_g1_i1:171-884(-)
MRCCRPCLVLVPISLCLLLLHLRSGGELRLLRSTTSRTQSGCLQGRARADAAAAWLADLNLSFIVYFKCDDDTFVHLPNFLALVTQLSSRFPDPLNKPYYFGDCSCWIQDSSWHPCGCPEPCDCTPFYENNVTYACGGAGYFMSRKALEMLIHYEQTVGAHRSGEDMMVGYALLLMNVSCIDSHRQLTLQYNFPLSWRTTDVWRNMISVHKVGPKRMVDLHQRAMGDKWDDVDTQPD